MSAPIPKFAISESGQASPFVTYTYGFNGSTFSISKVDVGTVPNVNDWQSGIVDGKFGYKQSWAHSSRVATLCATLIKLGVGDVAAKV